MLSLTKRHKSNSLSTIRTKLSQSKTQRYQNFFKPKGNLHLNLVTKTIPVESLKPMLSCSNKSIRIRPSFSKNPHIRSTKSDQFELTPSTLPESIYEALNDYEKEEILNYKQVFYAGTKDNKLVPDKDAKNLGYDGESGNYRMIKGDHLDYRYEIVSLIGQGTFGVVCECFDHKSKSGVAVKIIRNKKSFNKQAAIEVSVLRAMKDNDENDEKPVVKLRDFFVFRNHSCLVFDLLNVSLYEFEKMNKIQGIKEKQIKFFVRQILEGLCYLKDLGIIHCDLKPENILLTSSTCKKLKIIDFGSSCFNYEKIHSYIQSRYYRAPEIILGIPYTEAIDMWSLGCIVAEMLTCKVLLKGESELEQLMLMIELLGYPPEHVLQESRKKKLFFFKDNSFRMQAFSDDQPLVAGSKKLDWQNGPALNFVQKCLTWDPQIRLTPENALEHPWLQIAQKPKKFILKKSFIKKLT